MNQVIAERRERKAQAKARYANPYKIGDILHHSWGYEQTNCDFYQVVEVKPASVVLRKIGAKVVPGSEGFMYEHLLPVKDAFIVQGFQALTKNQDRNITPENPIISKRVCYYVKDDSSLAYYISTPFGWCDLWEGKPEYSSHYA